MTLSKNYNERFKEIRAYIRDREAKDHMTAASITQDGDFIEISYDKDALFKRNNIDSAERFTVNEKLDYELHSKALNATMNFALFRKPEASNQIQVSVRPRNKVLPVPLINIPIPFTERGANRVRPNVNFTEDDTLGLQPVRVKIRIPLSSIKTEADCNNLWVGLNNTAMVHTSNKSGEIIHDQLAGRNSRNPFRWIGRFLSFLVPFFLSRLLPNWLVNFGRVNQYGTPYATQLTDQPVINSGAVAQTVNTATGVSIALGVCAGLYLGCKNGVFSGDSSTTLGALSAGSTTDALIGLAVLHPKSIDTAKFCQGYAWGTLLNASLGVGLGATSIAIDNATRASQPDQSVLSVRQQKAIPVSHSGSAFFATKGRINAQCATKPLPDLQNQTDTESPGTGMS